MQKNRAADVNIGLWWDDRFKRWHATITGTRHSEWITVESTAEIGQAEAWLLLQSVKREVESWLA